MEKPDRTCKLCGKVFNYPSQLRRHQNAKRKCVPAFAKPRGRPRCRDSRELVVAAAPAGSAAESAPRDVGPIPNESEPGDPPKPADTPPCPACPNPPVNTCRYCGRTFTKLTHMYRHIRTRCKIAPNIRNGIDGMERLYTLIKEDDRRKGVLPSSPGGELAPIRIDARGASVNTTINITINVFGRESLDHITCGMVYNTMEPFINIHPDEATVQIILGLATIIYSDPAHPENITCYLPGGGSRIGDADVYPRGPSSAHPSDEPQNALVHEDMGWKIKPVTMVLPPMLAKSVQLALDKQPWPGENGMPENADIMGSQSMLGQLLKTPAAAAKRLLGPSGELKAVLVRNRMELSDLLHEKPE